MLRTYLAFAVAILMFLGIIVGCGWFYILQREEARRDIENEIVAIATLQAREVQNWFNERVRHGENLAGRPLLNKLLVPSLEQSPPGV